eukprot:NODE_537_length_6324_cov_1.677430.p4 type:complete len:213 gc:universal NODE_537_length_6324_cov_1.677430:3363-2725(-)
MEYREDIKKLGEMEVQKPIPLKINKVKLMLEIMDNSPKNMSELVFSNPCDSFDADDEFKREMSFYACALSNVKKAFGALSNIKRPSDYYCEMLKTDEMMEKMKKSLLKEKMEIENRDKKKEIQRLKKFGKKIQKKREVEKIKEKKSKLDNVKKFKFHKKIDELMDNIDDNTGDKKSGKFKSKSSSKFHSKSNVRKPKGKAKRPGKSKRHAGK